MIAASDVVRVAVGSGTPWWSQVLIGLAVLIAFGALVSIWHWATKACKALIDAAKAVVEIGPYLHTWRHDDLERWTRLDLAVRTLTIVSRKLARRLEEA